MEEKISRRELIKYGAGALSSLVVISVLGKSGRAVYANDDIDMACKCKSSIFKNRGVVVLDTDIMSFDAWPQMAKDAGLTILGLGPGANDDYIKNFLKAEKGQALLEKCKKLGIDVEHETHIMQYLLPRHYFDKDPNMFRVDEKGDRVREYNLCISSKEAMEIVGENAVKYARDLISTTGRYYFWIDDGAYMCRCKKCRQYSDSDQALIMENHIVKNIRKEINPNAQLAHLAYQKTFDAPTQVKPAPGVFLEFAPIYRLYTEPLSNTKVCQKDHITHGQIIEALEQNLEVFSRDTAKVLEYWLDVSRFSDWKRPAVKLPWNKKVFLDDLQTYAKRGIRDVTCYAAWIDADYIKRFGEPPMMEYGQGLCSIAARTS